MLNNDGSGRIAENLDSFEANHTLYTVLTSKKGEVLLNLQKQGIVFPTLTDTILFIQNLLKALLPFHEHGLLHLDISPDNLFLLSEEEEGKFPTEVLLLDFNSVYSMEGKLSGETQYYLGKPGFMAPEILLHQREELGPLDRYLLCDCSMVWAPDWRAFSKRPGVPGFPGSRIPLFQAFAPRKGALCRCLKSDPEERSGASA